MSCAACSARVENVTKALDGVDSCAVNLLTNSMTVEGNISPKLVISAVESAGYGASVDNSDKISEIKDEQTKKMVYRLLASVAVLLPLMYISMGHMMFGFALPSILDNMQIAGACQLVLALIIMIINHRFFVNGFKGIINKSPNMDTLVSLGSGVSFVYSVIILIKNAGDLYFESAAMILTLITIGKTLESYSKGKTTNAINSLLKLAPQKATVIENGIEKEVLINDIKINDIVAIKPGENVSVDGRIVEGASSIDESALTGESMPVEKTMGDDVYTGTININGYLKIKVTKVGNDTILSQIIKMVTDASATKAPIARIADKVSGVFVPVVIGISILVFIIWMLMDAQLSFSLNRAISILVISCPCALGLATPVAIMVGNGIGAKKGILFKNATALEETGKIDIVALDKTGTITNGKPVVTDIIPLNNFDKATLLEYAYSVEAKSEHPLAKAIIDYSIDNNVKLHSIADFKANIGSGVECYINDKKLVATTQGALSDANDIKQARELSSKGKTPVVFIYDDEIIGMIALCDTIRNDSSLAIAELQKIGIKVAMLTGDNELTANEIGRQAGVDFVISRLLPNEKEGKIKELQQFGKVAMVGDGINDSPALTRADIGIAVNSGTDIAIDSADIVLMNNNLLDVVRAIKLSTATLRNIKENLFWAFIYNIIGIPLASGLVIKGVTLSPMIAAGAMGLSSFCVVTNALRLNLKNIDKTKINKTNNIEIILKENKKMNKVFNVEGMMCGHCEAHVQNALLKIDGVESVVASHEENTVTVELSKDVSDDIIKQTINDEGYKAL